MTPKEKAEELVNKFYGYIIYENESVYSEKMLRVFKIKAKNCALIAVDELIKEVYNISHQYTAKYDEETKFYNYTESKELKFWIEVKKQIEAL